jgi:hypothetical protein
MPPCGSGELAPESHGGRIEVASLCPFEDRNESHAKSQTGVVLVWNMARHDTPIDENDDRVTLRATDDLHVRRDSPLPCSVHVKHRGHRGQFSTFI